MKVVKNYMTECEICMDLFPIDCFKFFPCTHKMCNFCYNNLKKYSCPYCRLDLEIESEDENDPDYEPPPQLNITVRRTRRHRNRSNRNKRNNNNNNFNNNLESNITERFNTLNTLNN